MDEKATALKTELDKEDSAQSSIVAKQSDNKTLKVTYKGYETTINTETGSMTALAKSSTMPPTPPVASLPTGAGTTPYLPSSSYKQLPGTGLVADVQNGITEGLVITDAEDPADTTNPGNEYVWIEVPNDGTGPTYTTVTSVEEDSVDYYTNIEEALIAYAGFAKTGSSDYVTTRCGWKDEWYDSTSHTYDGSKWYKYNGNEDTSYSESGNENDSTKCGLTYSEYNTLKQKMLKSIYKNGGFWIGRYEAGTTIARGANTDSISNLKPLSKLSAYTFNYVTCSQAQELAGRIDNIDSTYSTSLMFGIQWDLVIKYLENKAVSSSELKSDSITWGNYYNSQFDIDRGEYAIASPWNEFQSYTEETANKVTVEGGSSRKIANTQVLLTTGASDTNCKKNIYDLAGNVFEWTLEHSTKYGMRSTLPCACRGGSFIGNSSYAASSRYGHPGLGTREIRI